MFGLCLNPFFKNVYKYYRSMDVNYQLKTFDELSLRDLYKILKLRQEVFVVEQDCPYLDCDDLDYEAFHVLGMSDFGDLVSYSRLLPPDVAYEGSASIGRVLTHADSRQLGLGKDLMKVAKVYCQLLFEDIDIRISAQCYLIEFYKHFGFQTVGETYLEDGIPHIEMVCHNDNPVSDQAENN